MNEEGIDEGKEYVKESDCSEMINNKKIELINWNELMWSRNIMRSIVLKDDTMEGDDDDREFINWNNRMWSQSIETFY